MGNGTKVALVALLILMVVVVARFVKDDSSLDGVAEGAAPKGDAAREERKLASRNVGKQPPAASSSTARTTTRQSPGARLVTRRTTRSPAEGEPSTAGNRPEAPRGASRREETTPRSEGLPGARPISNTAELLAIGARSRRAQENVGAGGAAGSPGPGDGATPSRPSTSGGGASVPGRAPGEPIVTTYTEGDPPGSAAHEPPPAAQGTVRPPVPLGAGEKEKKEPASGEASPKADPAQRDTTAELADRRGGTPDITEYPPRGTPSRPRAGASDPAAKKFPFTYEIQKGDSPWAVAHRFWKNGNLYPSLLAANPGVKFQPGKSLTIPAPPEKPAPLPRAATGESGGRSLVARNVGRSGNSARPAPKRSERSSSGLYTVQKGDTLSRISKRFYGNANLWWKLEEANPDLKYTMLRAGMSIKIPE